MSRPQPAEFRILSALLLQPMSVNEVARVLAMLPQFARHRLDNLRSHGHVCIRGRTPTTGRAATAYGLTSKGQSLAQELVQ